MKITKICSSCGNEFEYEYKLNSNSNICPHCGRKTTDTQKNLTNNKKSFILSLLCGIFALVLLVIFLATDLSSMIFNAKEYKAYKYAIECVQDELNYPDTATYPSFKESTVQKSKYGTEIILDSYKGNISGQSFDKAWDISGSGTCENALGMTLNYRFKVTVVLSESGTLWCYKCIIN